MLLTNNVSITVGRYSNTHTCDFSGIKNLKGKIIISHDTGHCVLNGLGIRVGGHLPICDIPQSQLILHRAWYSKTNFFLTGWDEPTVQAFNSLTSHADPDRMAMFTLGTRVQSEVASHKAHLPTPSVFQKSIS